MLKMQRAVLAVLVVAMALCANAQTPLIAVDDVVSLVDRQSIRFESQSSSYSWPAAEMNMFKTWNTFNGVEWNGMMTGPPYSDKYQVTGFAYSAYNDLLFKGGRTNIPRATPETDLTIAFTLVSTNPAFSDANTAPIIVSVAMEQSVTVDVSYEPKIDYHFDAVAIDPEVQHCRDELGLSSIGIDGSNIPAYNSFVNVNYRNCEGTPDVTPTWSLIAVRDDQGDPYTSYTEEDYTIQNGDTFHAIVNVDDIFYDADFQQMSFFIQLSVTDGYMVSKHVIEIVRSRVSQTSVVTTLLVSPIISGVNVFPDSFLTADEYESTVLNISLSASKVVLSTTDDTGSSSRDYYVDWALATEDILTSQSTQWGGDIIEIDDTCEGLFSGYHQVTNEEVLSLDIDNGVLTTIQSGLEDGEYAFCYLVGTVTDSYADPFYNIHGQSITVVRIVVGKEIGVDSVPTFSILTRQPYDGQMRSPGYRFAGHVAAYNLLMEDDGCLPGYEDPAGNDGPDALHMYTASSIVAPVCNTTVPEGCEPVDGCLTPQLSYLCPLCNELDYGLYGPCYDTQDAYGNPGCFVTFHAVFVGSIDDIDVETFCADPAPTVTFTFSADTPLPNITNTATLAYTVISDDLETLCPEPVRRSINARSTGATSTSTNQVIQMVVAMTDYSVQSANFPLEEMLDAIMSTNDSSWHDIYTQFLGANITGSTMAYLDLQFTSLMAAMTVGALPTVAGTAAPAVSCMLDPNCNPWYASTIALASVLGAFLFILVAMLVVRGWRNRNGGNEYEMLSSNRYAL